jgi:hypothetical protein
MNVARYTKGAAMRNEHAPLRGILADAEGASFVELAFVLPLFLFMLIPVVDIGRAFYSAIEWRQLPMRARCTGLRTPAIPPVWCWQPNQAFPIFPTSAQQLPTDVNAPTERRPYLLAPRLPVALTTT